ncbi:MAG: hypothetical protein ACI8SR_002325 [Oceanicoccus sp.]|jgi:hypothetical protein
MKSAAPLADEQKLSVIYRVEPGCLGPQGASLVDDFCRFAQSQLQIQNSNYINCMIVPRTDKASPEMQYNVVGKKINFSQAEKYLALFDKNLDEFEGHLSEQLTNLINQFMGH